MTSIVFPPALAAWIDDLVARGVYVDEGEVVRDAVRQMQLRDIDPDTGIPVAQLRADIAAALEEVAAGKMSDKSVMEIWAEVRDAARTAAE